MLFGIEKYKILLFLCLLIDYQTFGLFHIIFTSLLKFLAVSSVESSRNHGCQIHFALAGL